MSVHACGCVRLHVHMRVYANGWIVHSTPTSSSRVFTRHHPQAGAMQSLASFFVLSEFSPWSHPPLTRFPGPSFSAPLQTQYLHLALSLHSSATAWLSTKGACDDVGRPPLAAVEAGVGEDELAGGALAPSAQRRLRLAVSRQVLRLLLQLLRCVCVWGGWVL